MELAYDLFVSAFTAILLSFLVAKLLSFAVSGGANAVDNGGKQEGNIGGVGGAEEGNLEKRLKVEGLKSKKKRFKKKSAETVLVSEFKGKLEPPVSVNILGGLSEADDFVDDSKKLGSVEEKKDLEFPNEGLDQETNQGNDLGKLIDFNDRRDDDDDTIDKHQRGLESVNKVGDVQNEEIGFCVSKENGQGEMEISDGEEWEGIEINVLDKDFARAVNYVECVEKQGWLNRLGSDVIMQFHDLQRIAMEGPCHEPKLSVRAKWNSWQKSGSMIPEEAMEKYITLLSDKVPGWMDDWHPCVQSKISSEKNDTFSSSDTAVKTPLTVPLACTNDSKPGEEPVTGTGGDLAGRSSSVNKDEE